jgi:hypothetical protein
MLPNRPGFTPLQLSKQVGAVPFSAEQETASSRQDQSKGDTPALTRPTAGSLFPQQAEDPPTSKPSKIMEWEDDGPSFEDRIVELQEYDEEHGDLRVPVRYSGGRSNDLGVWGKRILGTYQ